VNLAFGAISVINGILCFSYLPYLRINILFDSFLLPKRIWFALLHQRCLSKLSLTSCGTRILSVTAVVVFGIYSPSNITYTNIQQCTCHAFSYGQPNHGDYIVKFIPSCLGKQSQSELILRFIYWQPQSMQIKSLLHLLASSKACTLFA